jgi:hypothetical protein
VERGSTSFFEQDFYLPERVVLLLFEASFSFAKELD